MALLNRSLEGTRVRAWILCGLSFTPFAWIALAANVSAITFEAFMVGFVATGLLSLASLVGLVVLVVQLTQRSAAGREDRKRILKACLIFGQFGAVWSVYVLTTKES